MRTISFKKLQMHFPKLTIFGRSLFLIVAEVLVNALFWVVAGILFGRREDTRDILSLAMLAWARTVYLIHFALE
jgi:nickel/cobalt transporter (NiCoT) family protein